MASSSSSNKNNNNSNMDSLHDGRNLFKRLIINTARAPYRVVEMISLWLSHFTPQISFIHQILSMSDPEMDLVPVEAELILDSLLPGHSSSDDDNDVPITAVFEGISDILSSLRSMVSEDLVTRMNGLNVSYRVGGLQIKANNEARSSDAFGDECREYAAIEWDRVLYANGVGYDPWEFKLGGTGNRREAFMGEKKKIEEVNENKQEAKEEEKKKEIKQKDK
ncbi:hypothetical protein QJS04_geneDACA016654 [Acorus gramineus]|uniref:Uncharacterized protein n=1 Tax=Acorus gramineus TaxID=55184 RepID=A0AAV9ANS3_ACOGR|nr:hypothetical protein QJS04_geneDACA016654 [Acorus gramineus]